MVELINVLCNQEFATSTLFLTDSKYKLGFFFFSIFPPPPPRQNGVLLRSLPQTLQVTQLLMCIPPDFFLPRLVLRKFRRDCHRM